MSGRPSGEAPPYAAGQVCEQCTVVLQGRLHVVCGSEGFESDRGPWTVLGAPSLRLPHYEADFTARVMEPSRLLRITRADYEAALRHEAEALAAAVRAAACHQSYASFSACRPCQPCCPSSAGSVRSGGGDHSPRSPVARVACTLAPELASAYAEQPFLTSPILSGHDGSVGSAAARVAGQVARRESVASFEIEQQLGAAAEHYAAEHYEHYAAERFEIERAPLGTSPPSPQVQPTEMRSPLLDAALGRPLV